MLRNTSNVGFQDALTKRLPTTNSKFHSALKKGVLWAGTYHAFDFRKYADRYLAEVQYRFNRRFELSAILKRLVRAAVTTPPRLESVIRLAGVAC
jgi:hypothetical protein